MLLDDVHIIGRENAGTVEIFFGGFEDNGYDRMLPMKRKSKNIGKDTASGQKPTESFDAVRSIQRGLDDVKQGRTKTAKRAFNEIRQKYGIPRNARS